MWGTLTLTINEWWTRLKNWTMASIVGAKQETVESFLETEQFRDIAQDMDDHLQEFGRFPQILRNKDVNNGRPNDRPDQAVFIPNFPGWVDYEIHEQEATEGLLWKLFIYVKDGPNNWVWEGDRRVRADDWIDPTWTLEDERFPPLPESSGEKTRANN